MLVPENKNAEPGKPVQHFFLYIHKIIYSKSAVSIGCDLYKKIINDSFNNHPLPHRHHHIVPYP